MPWMKEGVEPKYAMEMVSRLSCPGEVQEKGKKIRTGIFDFVLEQDACDSVGNVACWVVDVGVLEVDVVVETAGLDGKHEVACSHISISLPLSSFLFPTSAS